MFQKFVTDYGLPQSVITDRGICFTSKSFDEYCVSNSINHSTTSVRHLQVNGLVECTNTTLLPMIQVNMKTERTWDKNLHRMESQFNNSINKTISEYLSIHYLDIIPISRMGCYPD